MPELVKKAAPKRDDSDSDDDLPLGARIIKSKPKKPFTSKPKPKKRKVESDSDDEPIGSLIKKNKTTPRPHSSSKPKSSDARKKAKPGSRSTASAKGKKLWKTLEHNGVVFPPPYEPHGVPLVYDGEDVALLPHEEEVASFFAVMKDTEYAQKEVFVKNFFEGFKRVLKHGPNKRIKEF
jgi:DNA topoisomerase-1